jgi:hypothetical protein
MTIGLVKSAGWGLNEKLTSGQQTLLDQHASWALDGRSGQSDTCASTISATGAWTFSNLVTFQGTGSLATAIADANFNGTVTFVGGNTTFGQATGGNYVVTFNGNSGSPEVVVFGAYSAVTFSCTAGAVDFTGTAVNFGGTSGAPTVVTFGPYAPCTFQGSGSAALNVAFGSFTNVTFAGNVAFNSGFAVAVLTTATFDGPAAFNGTTTINSTASFGTSGTFTFNGNTVFANTNTTTFAGTVNFNGTNTFTTALQPSGTAAFYQLRTPHNVPTIGSFTPSDNDVWTIPTALGSIPLTITCNPPSNACRFAVKQIDATAQSTSMNIVFGSALATFSSLTSVYSTLEKGALFMEWDGTRFSILSLFDGRDANHPSATALVTIS